MASARLGGELTCSICLSIYTDPVSLSCGHDFCHKCIEKSFDFQLEWNKERTCPECRMSFRTKPSLKKNLKLSSIVECFNSTSGSSNTDPYLAMTSKPLSVARKCSTHNEPLTYYCTVDNSCICASCRLFGIHKGHRAETINEAYKKKKRKLQDIIEKLSSKKDDVDKKAVDLDYHRGQVENKAIKIRERMTCLFRDIQEQIRLIEKQTMTEISRQETRVSTQVTDQIHQLELQKLEIAQEIHCMEQIHKITDPISFLMEWGAVYGSWEGSGQDDINSKVEDDLDDVLIAVTLQNGLLKLNNILNDLKAKQSFYVDCSSMILYDSTAAHNLLLSGDLKTATYSIVDHPKFDSPPRFKSHQVLSTRSFHTGQNYWEIEVSDFGDWRVGVEYESIERRGMASFLRYNNKSWCLNWSSGHLTSWSHYRLKSVTIDSPVRVLGIYVDYEAGVVSFYRLDDQVVPLCTITTTFTEPLCAAFYISEGWIRIRP
ncbi:nuclear factor 7, brain-like [Discoglossus pictus]